MISEDHKSLQFLCWPFTLIDHKIYSSTHPTYIICEIKH